MTVSAPADRFAELRAQFPIFRHTTYLNSCSLGALSDRTRAALGSYLDEWERRGASAWYDTWLPAVDRLRDGYGRVVGAGADSISIHSCISTALSVVAESLDYTARPKVVTTSLDFPTVAYQWLSKGARGVEVEVLESPDGIGVPLELFERAIDERTALVATSHVFFTSGTIQDVAALTRLAHARGARLLVDGYQGAGQVPVHLGQADFYCSGGLKWLLGGSGIAFLYVRPDLIAALEPGVTGWFAHADPFQFDSRRLRRAGDARRFDLGTPSVASVYAQLAGLEVLFEAGLEQVQARTVELTADLIGCALDHGLAPRVAPAPADRSAIVMLPSADPARDVRRLAEAGFIVDARPGHVRISPYFYNLPGEHRACIEVLARG